MLGHVLWGMTDGELFPTLASEAAKAMSALGASKGGKARANTMTKEQRSEVARNAVRARWAKAGKLKQPEGVESEATTPTKEPVVEMPIPAMPYSMFKGSLKLGNVEMECHVLNDGRRVFTQREMVRALTGSAGVMSGNLSRYLERNPLIHDEKALGPEIEFKVPGSSLTAIGREATTLIEICEKYLEARDQNKLKSSQNHLAVQAEIIIRSCAKVGIIALIDEATGYQKIRAKNALQLKLQAFIADDLQEWARMFPEDFWLELARLEGIHYSPRSRPLRWGKYIMAFVYDAIDKDVGKQLRAKNPNPHFRLNHHQWLKKFGREKVHDQIQRVVTIMKLCDSMDEFRKKFDRVFRKSPIQASFEDIDWNMN